MDYLNILKLNLVIFSFFTIISCQQKANKLSENDRTITTSALEKMKKQGNLVILDVRTAAEVAEGAIPGAIHIDISQPDFNEKILALDKQMTIVTYCKSGGRAGRACDQLEAAGFNKTKNYGGYSRWLKERSKE